MQQSPSLSTSGDRLKYAIPLVLLCGFTLITFLGLTPFNTRGEPREAIVAVSMMNDGNWILPINNGDEIAFKPPLLHWLVAIFSWLSGGVSEFTSRLPSALSATAMVVGTFCFFSRRSERHTAMFAALITLTNFEVHRAAMTCRVDMLLAALMVLACFSLCRWGEKQMKGIPWAALACLAGAALTKGPVGIILPCAATGLYLWLRGYARFLSIAWRFAVVALAATLPLLTWYYAAYCQPHGGERFLHLVYEENVLRFIGKMTYASHENPWYYNVMTLLAGMLPYTLMLLLILPLGLKKLAHGCLSKCGNIRTWHPVIALRRMQPADLFALTVAAVIFVFYCIPASKRSVYLLPVYPFAAWFAARLLLHLSLRQPGMVKVFGGIMATLAVVLAAAFAVVKGGSLPETIFSGRHAAENASYLYAIHSIPWGFWTCIAWLLPVPVAGNLFCSSKRPRPLLIVGIIVAINISLDSLYIPAIMRVKTDREVALKIGEITKNNAPIYSYRTDVVEANRMHPFTINFYLDNRIVPIDKAQTPPKSGFLVSGNDDIDSFKKTYPQYSVERVYDSGHRSCDDRKVIRLYRIRLKR